MPQVLQQYVNESQVRAGGLEAARQPGIPHQVANMVQNDAGSPTVNSSVVSSS